MNQNTVTRNLPYLDRFKRPYYEVDAETGCWNWLRGFVTGGYGCIWSPEKKSNDRAHRYFYKKAKGPIPEGHQIDHLCKNVRCVNPEHLESVTGTENVRRSTATTLTPRIVAIIRHRHLTCPSSYEQTAQDLGITRCSVGLICRNIRWKDPEYQKLLEVIYGDPRRMWRQAYQAR